MLINNNRSTLVSISLHCSVDLDHCREWLLVFTYSYQLQTFVLFGEELSARKRYKNFWELGSNVPILFHLDYELTQTVKART